MHGQKVNVPNTQAFCFGTRSRIFDVRTDLKSSTRLICFVRFMSYTKYVYEVHLFYAAVFIDFLCFEVLIQIENTLFLNTINILTEYRYKSNRIYQELLEFIKYSFLITIQR